MKLKTLFIAGALTAVFSQVAAAQGGTSAAQQVEEIRRKFFMPVATNSLCPEEYRVSAEKFAALRSSALAYLDYLQTPAPSAANPQFEKARAEIAGTDIAPSFLAEAEKIYRQYPPAKAHDLFCTRLTRMFDTNIDIMAIQMRQEQNRRGGSRPD